MSNAPMNGGDFPPYDPNEPDDDDDDGPLNMELTQENGQVLMAFTRPTALLTLNGDQAMELAQQLIHLGKACGTTRTHTFIL